MSQLSSYRHVWSRFKRQITGQSMTAFPFVFGSWLHRFPSPRQEFTKSYHKLNQNKIYVIGDLYLASDNGASTKLRILIPGLSSNHRSAYLAKHVSQSLASKNDVLCLSMRGVLGLGCDIHHAGFTEDLHHVFNDPNLSHYQEITLMGFSMGGLVVLNFARECSDSRLKALATLCAPLQLSKVQKHLDQPRQAIYRQLLFRSLKRAYQQVWQNAAQSPYPLKSNLEGVLACNRFADWDQQVIISRFSFNSIADYHQQVSFSTQDLKALKYPSYLLFNEADPMIKIEDIGVNVGELNELCTIQFAPRGGHLGFYYKLDLGLSDRLGVSAQINAWFDQLSYT